MDEDAELTDILDGLELFGEDFKEARRLMLCGDNEATLVYVRLKQLLLCIQSMSDDSLPVALEPCITMKCSLLYLFFLDLFILAVTLRPWRGGGMARCN